MKKDKKFNSETLGGRLKGYEAEYESSIEPKKHIIARIDGHHFSKFTRGFEKPFDEILSKAMEYTTKDLLEEFNAVTAYQQSDEITLVIPSLMTAEKHRGENRPLWKHSYNGRIQKMSSLIAGFTTMKFNKHFEKLTESYGADNSYDDRYRFLMNKAYNAWFDCRIYGVPSDEEAFNSVLWRVRDCIKNSKSVYAQTYCSHKQLQGLTGQEQVQYCKEKTGNDWEEVEDRYKYGILVKRQYYIKEVDANIPGVYMPEKVQRSEIVSWSQHLVYSDENVKMVMSKVK